jgi:hypothetical protein
MSIVEFNYFIKCPEILEIRVRISVIYLREMIILGEGRKKN